MFKHRKIVLNGEPGSFKSYERFEFTNESNLNWGRLSLFIIAIGVIGAAIGFQFEDDNFRFWWEDYFHNLNNADPEPPFKPERYEFDVGREMHQIQYWPHDPAQPVPESDILVESLSSGGEKQK